MSEGGDSTTTGAAPVEIIDRDLPCVLCGYNLRSLPTTGRCPECGSAVARSVHGDWLRYADAVWLKRIAGGARRVAIGWIAILVGVVYLIAAEVTVYLARIEPELSLSAVCWLVFMPAGLVALVALILIATGLHSMAAPEPIPRPRYTSRLHAARTLSVLLVPAIVLGLASEFTAGSGNAISMPITVHVAVCAACIVLLWFHMMHIIGQAHHLDSRCKEMTAERPKKLTTYRTNSTVLLVLYILWMLGFLHTESSAAVFESLDVPVITGGALFVWYLVVGLILSTGRLVRSELEAARSAHPARPTG